VGQAYNIAMMVASGGAAGWSSVGAGQLTRRAIGNTWNAVDAARNGDVMGAAMALPGRLDGTQQPGTVCQVSSRFAALGTAAEAAAAAGTRAMLGFGATMARSAHRKARQRRLPRRRAGFPGIRRRGQSYDAILASQRGRSSSRLRAIRRLSNSS